MNIQITLPDDYAAALTLLAVSLGRRSRQKLIAEVLTSFVDKNPEALAKARETYHVEADNIVPKGILDDMPLVKYIFTRHDDSEVEGVGRGPGEAVEKIMGRRLSVEEYAQEFKSRREV